jgi:hypothetical protein
MSESPAELPEAKVVAKPTSITNVIVAALVAIAIATVVGFIVAYVSALLVVKVGLPVPKIVVGAPLVVVLAIAWATTIGQSIRDGVVTAAIGAAIAAALIVVWAPPDPASLFEHQSKVTDVQVHNGDATLQLESKTTMTEMPAVGLLAGYAALLAALAVAACTVGHAIRAVAKKRESRPF